MTLQKFIFSLFSSFCSFNDDIPFIFSQKIDIWTRDNVRDDDAKLHQEKVIFLDLSSNRQDSRCQIP